MFKGMEMNKAIRNSLVVSLLALGLNATANAEDHVIAFAGFDVTKNSDFIYVGGVTRFDTDFSQSGWLARVMVNHLNYDFDDANVNYKARAWGGSVAGGYSFVRSSGYTTISLGLASRNTDYNRPVVNGNDGSKTGLIAQIEHNQAISDSLSFEGMANYTSNVQDYWARARVMYKVTDSVRVGPELTGFGNDDFDAIRGGIAVTGISLFNKANLGLNLGAEHKTRDNAHTYGGMIISTAF
jgi:hypothetical protein